MQRRREFAAPAIDLARNALSIAAPASVRVQNAMRVVRYESVMHIVSEVYGSKPRGVSAFEVLGTIFPAGTLSGSPKIRAMQIINELERYERGIYGGGIGFWRFSGDVMQAILIRSAIFVNRGEAQNLKPRASKRDATLNLKTRADRGTLNLESEPRFSRAMRFEAAKFSAENFGCERLNNLVFIGAGAGIVYDSSPKSEYAEICKKRKSPLKVIEELYEEA